VNTTAVGLLAALALLAAPAAALDRASLDRQMECHAREARRDLKIENLAALERAPANFLAMRPGPREADARWVQVEIPAATSLRREAPR
jgi:hypothetical protein